MAFKQTVHHIANGVLLVYKTHESASTHNTHTHTHTLYTHYSFNTSARLFLLPRQFFFFKLNNILTVKVYYKYKYIQNTWLPTTASNFLTSNYEHYINCKQQFIVYLNKYK